MPAKYVRPYAKGQKNDFNDAEAIAEAVQRPTMKFVATKTADQLDLQALHRVRERLVSQRTGIINQIRAFMLERGIAVRQGIRFLRAELSITLASRTDSGACGSRDRVTWRPVRVSGRLLELHSSREGRPSHQGRPFAIGNLPSALVAKHRSLSTQTGQQRVLAVDAP